MKYIAYALAIFMGASCVLAAPTLEKEPIQNLGPSLEALASALFKTSNLSVSTPEPQRIGSTVPPGGAKIKARDLLFVVCDLFYDDHGFYSTPRLDVKHNLDKLRTLPDKPKEVEEGKCGTAICENLSAISWCVNNTVGHPYTVDNWNLIADGAQKILDTCTQGDSLDAAVSYDDGYWIAVTRCDKGT